MAGEDELELAEETPKSSRMKWVIIGIAAVVLIAGGGGAAWFLVGGGAAEKGEPTADGEQPSEEKKGEAIYVAIDPPFTVNFQGNSRARFLQISVQAMTRDPETREVLEKNMPVIRNDLVMLFSSKTASELKTREGKEQLQAETLAGVRRIVEGEADPERVEAVYFTSFVMQ